MEHEAEKITREYFEKVDAKTKKHQRNQTLLKVVIYGAAVVVGAWIGITLAKED